MRKGKKFLALLLAVVLCFGIVPVNLATANVVYAAEENMSSYGVQLTTQQKEIYDALVDNYIGKDGLANGETEDYVFTPSNPVSYDSADELEAAVLEDVGHAATAFVEDYPQVYWANGYGYGYGYSTTTSGNSTKYKVGAITVKLNPRFPVSDAQIEEFNTGIQNAVDEIEDGLSTSATMYEKYIAIHDWICEQAYYNYDGLDASKAPETHTSYPIFHKDGNGGVVCEGYAKAFKILCDQMDLTCMLVSGQGVNSSGPGAHMWNSVLMSDGKWYGVDVTWDDQDTKTYYDYFLCGKKSLGFTDRTFGEDHLEDNEILTGITFEYPDVAEYGYNGYLGNISYSYNDGVLTIYGNGDIPEYSKVDRIPWYQYMDEITSVVIGEGITSISEGCLAGLDNLESLTIPYVGLSKDATGENAVLGAVFGKITGGTKQWYKQEGNSFYSYTYNIPLSLKKVVVTNDDNLELGAFSNCSNLQSIILNEGIESVGSRSLYNCSSLTEVVIPNSVTSIGERVLQGCDNLKRITLPFIGSNADASETKDAVLGYVFGYGDGASSDTVQSYGNQSSYYAIPGALQSVIVTKDTTIPYGAFDSCINITEIQLQANVTTIDKYAFRNCTSLRNVTFMGDAPTIDSYAFSGCGVITANIPHNNDTWTDSVKQKYSAERINWNIENSTDAVAKISNAKISLGDKIAVKFMVTLDDSVSEDDYMLVTVNGETTTIKVKDATVEKSNLTGEDKYVFEYRVNAKEMTKSIQAQMVVDGVEGSTVTYSVKKYAYTILDLASGTYETEKAMIRAMLNYGGYAQTYFEEGTDLANEGLYETDDPVLNLGTLDLEAYAPSGTNKEKLTASLLLESETELRFYFTPESGKTLDDYSFKVEGTNKALVTGTKDGKCYVAIPGICANELQDMYTVTIYSKDTNVVYASLTYGAFSYVRTVLNGSTTDVKLQNLVKALYIYSQAAVDYSK